MFVTHGFSRIIRGNLDLVQDSDIEVWTLSVGGDTAKAGHIVTQDDATDQSKIIDLAVTTDENALGIIIGPVTPADTYDLDDAIVDASEVYVLRFRGRGIKVAAFLEAKAGPVAVNPGEVAIIGSEAGKIRKWAYTDAASETDTLEEKVGTFEEYDAGSTADDHVVIISV